MLLWPTCILSHGFEVDGEELAHLGRKNDCSPRPAVYCLSEIVLVPRCTESKPPKPAVMARSWHC